MKIKEKVLKELRPPIDKRDIDLLKEAIDLTLAEVKEVSDNLKKKEKECMKKDEYEEQIVEHTNQIEMCGKILKEIGI